MALWNRDTENDFFTKSQAFATPEQLFYRADDDRLYAYWPKTYKGKKSTLQSRNALIGNYTEKWSVDVLKDFADTKNWYSVQGIVCNELGLTRQSPADVAYCTTQSINQTPENIKAIFEVKMSIVWNWEFTNNNLVCLGDYTTHKGTPGLLRSDSMLKAIGKSINIRVSSYSASNIPIIILGNTPITEMYRSKVDHLKKSGIIQGFWSLNPDPRDGNETLDKTVDEGFIRIDTEEALMEKLTTLVSEEMEFFYSRKTKTSLGQIIEIANQEETYEAKAERFLQLIRE